MNNNVCGISHAQFSSGNRFRFFQMVRQAHHEMKKQIIYLVGFMGSGKSTIGPILANALGYTFADVDKLIEEKEGRSISNIFKSNGESYFRDAERSIITEVSALANTVIALGGGAVTRQENLKTIKRTGIVVYLKASSDHISERLKHQEDRPLIQDENGHPLSDDRLRERINSLLQQREPFYQQADIVVTVDNKFIEQIVDEIITQLNRFYN